MVQNSEIYVQKKKKKQGSESVYNVLLLVR